MSFESVYLFPLFISREYLHKVLLVVHIRDFRGFLSKVCLLLFHSCFLYSSEGRPYLCSSSHSVQLRQGALAVYGFYDLAFCCFSESFCFVFALFRSIAQIKLGFLSFNVFLIKTSLTTFFDVYRNLSIFVGTRYHYVFSCTASSDSLLSDSSVDCAFQQATEHKRNFLSSQIPFGEMSAFSHFRTVKQDNGYLVVYVRSVGA